MEERVIYVERPRKRDGYVSTLLTLTAILIGIGGVLYFGRPHIARLLEPPKTTIAPADVSRPVSVPRPMPRTAPRPVQQAEPAPVEAAPVEEAVPIEVAPPADLSVPEQVDELATYADQATGGGWVDEQTGAVLPYDPSDQEAVDTMNRALANSGQPTMTPVLTAEQEREIACAADLAAGGRGC